MVGQLNLNQLKEFAPQSPILVFRHADTGSPMQDWCRHLSQHPLRRQELEEFAILGDVVVRIADELEPDPLEKVRIMSLEYAFRTLGDEVDGREFVRCVRAIASPDASQYEYEQIAAYYYGEIRSRGASEVLKEMGLLGMRMEAVTSSIADREIAIEEVDTGERKLTVADQRRSQEAAQKRKPLPPRTPIFDEELVAVLHRVGRQRVRRMLYDDFAEFYLSDDGKTIDDLDQDFLTYESIEQYDENGVIGSSAMSIKRALSIAGTIKGILGISEFEKAVSGMKSSNKTDGGETARTISYLLNWMQDNRDVLVFATANDVRELESEQFRIGRFSYIHFVDLPDMEDRQEIFRVHLRKRELDPESFDLDKLVDKSKDFSGAEIEGAVKDGVLEAFIDGDRSAETPDILKAVESLTPTAQMMSEKIEEIRKWARNNIKGVGIRNDTSALSGQKAERVYEL